MNRMKVTIEHDDDRHSVSPFTREGLLVQRRRAREPQITEIREAFGYAEGPSGTIDLEKAILASAFLLEFNSEGGNERLDGMVANGIADTLRRCAAEVRKLYTRDDVVAAGGNVDLLAPAGDPQ
jgi:hypothetical protein